MQTLSSSLLYFLISLVSKLHCSFEFYTVESSSLFAISLKQGDGITVFEDCYLETMGFSGFYVQSCILRRIWRGQGKSTRFPSRLGTSCSTRGGRCGVNDNRGLWERNGWDSAHHKAEYILQLIKPVHSEVMALIQGERGVMYRDAQESDDGDPDKRIIYLNAWRRAWQPTPVFLPGEFHGQRNLVGYSAPGVAKTRTRLTNARAHTHTHTHTHKSACTSRGTK